MENNYYTPSIEDIHVGYEYEYSTSHPEEPENIHWATKKFPDPFVGYRLDGFKSQIDRGSIRVPHLNKQQLEAEGWKYTGKSIDLWFEKEGSFQIGSWTSYKLILHYGLHDHRLYINAEDQGTEATLYQGECKSINEFRTLMKWLQI